MVSACGEWGRGRFPWASASPQVGGVCSAWPREHSSCSFPGAVPASSHAAGAQPPPFLAGQGASATGAVTAAPAAASLPRRFHRHRGVHGAHQPDRRPVRLRRARLRRREERPDQGLRQPRRHDADGLRRPAHAGRRLLGPRPARARARPDFPTSPYVYVLYAVDAPPGGTARRGTTPARRRPGPTTDGCVVTGRLVRLQLSGDTITGSPQVLLSDLVPAVPEPLDRRPRLRSRRRRSTSAAATARASTTSTTGSPAAARARRRPGTRAAIRRAASAGPESARRPRAARCAARACGGRRRAGRR